MQLKPLVLALLGSPSALLAVGITLALPAQAARVTALDLGAYGVNTLATGINDSGQMVGQLSFNSYVHAFITGANGIGVTDMGNLGYSNAAATGINAGGQVAVSTWEPGGWSSGAFLTGYNGTGVIAHPTLGGANAHAGGVNDSGQLAGASQTQNGTYLAFITGPNCMGVSARGTPG